MSRVYRMDFKFSNRRESDMLSCLPEYADVDGSNIKTATITSVGLGPAAFICNISVTLGEPLAAIVPGYGVADAIVDIHRPGVWP